MKTQLEEQISNLRQQAGSEIPPQVGQLSQPQTLSFVNPTEFVTLPSEGLFYPEGHPLRNQKEVEIKQMTAKEEDILTNKSFLKKGILLDRLIESLLVSKNIPTNSILVGDRNAIVIAARISAYGPTYDLGVVCTECGHKNQVSIDLEKAESRNIEKIIADLENSKDLYTITPSGAILIKLPKTGWDVACRLLSGEDEKRMTNIIESKKRTNNVDADITISEQLDLIIESINGSLERSTIKSAIGLMPAYDAKFLRNAYSKLIPNVLIKSNFVCGSCLDGQEVEVPFTQEFFWPK